MKSLAAPRYLVPGREPFELGLLSPGRSIIRHVPAWMPRRAPLMHAELTAARSARPRGSRVSRAGA